MAYDEELDVRVEELLGAWGTGRKKMFGGTCPFDISKNPASGWVMVGPDGLDPQSLEDRLQQARDYVTTLPEK